MKALKLSVIGMLLFFACTVHAQVSVSVNVGVPPPWGPVGYAGVRYYYLPDVEAYYDINTAMFIYYGGAGWIRRAYLPERYRGYDLYGGYKVPMTGYKGNTPYTNFKQYRTEYAKGYRGAAQRNIGARPGPENSRGKVSSNGHQDRNVGHGNERGNSHAEGGRKEEEHGHDEGNGRK